MFILLLCEGDLHIQVGGLFLREILTRRHNILDRLTR